MKPKQENKNVSEPQLKPYPEWVCYHCGNDAQTDKKRIFSVSTMTVGRCDVCGKERSCTEPRDFGYPTFEGHEKP